jgi:hypothetical protein
VEMPAFSVLVAGNKELIAEIGKLICNAYYAMRALDLPPIDPKEHFERREARITYGVFDGLIPSDDEFDEFSKLDPLMAPRFYRDIIKLTRAVFERFQKETGKSPIHGELDVFDRTMMWRMGIAAAEKLLRDQEVKRKRRQRRQGGATGSSRR